MRIFFFPFYFNYQTIITPKVLDLKMNSYISWKDFVQHIPIFWAKGTRVDTSSLVGWLRVVLITPKKLVFEVQIWTDRSLLSIF